MKCNLPEYLRRNIVGHFFGLIKIIRHDIGGIGTIDHSDLSLGSLGPQESFGEKLFLTRFQNVRDLLNDTFDRQ